MQILGTGLGVAVGFIASCGPSQIYGLIKGAVQLIKIAHSSAQIKKINKQLEHLQNLPPDQQDSKNMELALKQKISARRKYDTDELKQAGRALVPFVGAIWAYQQKGYSVGPLAPFTSTAEDIAHVVKPKGVPGILFPGAKLQVGFRNAWWDTKEIHLPVKTGDATTRTIEAIWLPGTNCKETDRTVILYHGNAMTMWGMDDAARKYQEAGFNVLLTTIGGKQYEQASPEGSSNDTFETSELSMYADVDAEIAFLQSKGVTEIGVHGLSIGGTKAFQAAVKYPSLVKFVVGDQTLTSSSKVAANLAKNIVGAYNIGYAVGISAAPHCLSDGINDTDGFDSAAKAARLNHTQVEVLTIASKEDVLMGRDKKNNVFTHNFAEDLLKARYGKDTERQPLWIEGEHSAPIDDDTYDKILHFANKACPKNTQQ